MLTPAQYRMRLLEVARCARAMCSLNIQDMKYGNKRFNAVLIEMVAAVQKLDQRDQEDGEEDFK